MDWVAYVVFLKTLYHHACMASAYVVIPFWFHPAIKLCYWNLVVLYCTDFCLSLLLYCLFLNCWFGFLILCASRSSCIDRRGTGYIQRRGDRPFSLICVCLQRSRYYSNMYCTGLFGVQRFSPADSNGDGMICPEELESEGVALYFLNCYSLSFPFQVMFPCKIFFWHFQAS